ncbi:LPXTG cell wall anchor domain-containing protein [Streptacidiphilus sp. EB103A]|uniref:LPXTG cell wall anchor domain-containing protein n=1 Tax=Streptacidiphilus sp. EB103A TaxID=3156275 RepID=UPI003514358B
MRVATAALALTGTGLLVGGVASAATTPTLVQSKVIDGPQSSAVGLDPSLTDPTVTDSATASDGATATGPSANATAASSATAAATATGTAAAVVGGSATATASASATRSASSSSAAGSGSSGGGTSAPQPRQMLAETGTDQSAPLLFAGGLTLLAGGLVFRFGPRTGTPRHAA